MAEEINVDAITKDTLDRARFFQTVQAWPLSDKLNYEGWLKNFKNDGDKKLAQLILDFFMYYPDGMVDQMLKTSVGYAGYTLSQRFSGWKHSDFKNRCIYTSIPGERPHSTDSGHLFARKLRDALGIPTDRIIDFKEIPRVLDELALPTAVIFVDDFVGSGSQCDTAWNRHTFNYNGKTLKTMSSMDRHTYIYAPLIVNSKGQSRITRECPSLLLSPAHVIGSEYNLFDPSCFCWKGNSDLYKAGVEMILRKSKELDIPSTGGVDCQDEKGYCEQGLALSFAHGAPDAIPSFFYWIHDDWTPLIHKEYER